MVVAQQFVLIIVLLNFFCGCQSKNSKLAQLAEIEARQQSAQRQIVEKQRQAKQLEQQIDELKKVIAGREGKWRESVAVRHPDWSPQRRENQINILVHKWIKSNRTKDEDTVREMRFFGERGYALSDIPVYLVDDDLWDIARAKSANWGTEDQISPLSKQLNDLNVELQSLQKLIDKPR